MLDTVVEVLDPRTGRLISSLRTDHVFFWWAGDMLYSYGEEDDGNLFIDVWRFRLIQPMPLEIEQ